jgi:type I restriction enzyme S subunit
MRLKDVARVQAGQSPPSSEVRDLAEGLPFLQGNAEFGHRFPEPRYECSSTPKRARTGDVLLSVRAPVGAINIADRSYGIGRGLASIRALCADSEFIWWWLHSQRPALDAVSTGTTYRAVTAEDVANLQFPQLDLDRQRRIADFLDDETTRIDQLVNAQQLVISLIGERRKRVLEDILIGSEAAASWSPLGYLTEYDRPIMYGIVLPGPNVEDGVPIVKGGDVAAGRLSLALLNKTTYEIEASFTRSRLRAGDLVIAIRGSVGEVASVPEEVAGANLTQDAARIAVGPCVHPRWLELVLQTPAIQEQIGGRITGATIKGINIWDLRRILVPQVSLDEQSRTAKAADAVLVSMDAFTNTANRQLALLAERRQALIAAAVTGGIAV